MSAKKKTEKNHIAEAKAALVKAALDHVMFDGWGAQTLAAAIEDSGVDPTLANQACPRGAVDLAIAFHRQGDAAMVVALEASDLGELRFRDRIALGVRLRLETVAENREAVRRGAALFALPQRAGDGAGLIWGTADLIWQTLGDTSEDLNWYTKRATLSGVYSATLLFWLGDDSDGFSATWAFLDRRIDDVMQFESFKAKVRDNPLVKSFMAGPGRIFDHIKAPKHHAQSDLPGHLSEKG